MSVFPQSPADTLLCGVLIPAAVIAGLVLLHAAPMQALTVWGIALPAYQSFHPLGLAAVEFKKHLRLIPDLNGHRELLTSMTIPSVTLRYFAYNCMEIKLPDGKTLVIDPCLKSVGTDDLEILEKSLCTNFREKADRPMRIFSVLHALHFKYRNFFFIQVKLRFFILNHGFQLDPLI